MAPVVFVAGYSNTGKTTLMKNLIKALKEKGFKVAAVKHAAHGYETDVPGRDTWHYCQSGADQVVVVGPHSLTTHRLHSQEPPLSDVYQMIEDVDLILVEGFKREPGLKIEVVREGKQRLPLGDGLIAVVGGDPQSEGVPCFAVAEVNRLADFLLDYFFLQGCK